MFTPSHQGVGMSVLSRLWRLGGLTVLMLAILSLIGWAIWEHGERLGLDTTNRKIVAFLLVCVLGAALRFGPALLRLVRQIMHRNEEKQQNVLPGSEPRLEQTPPRHITITELRQALRQTYGRFWPRKVRILLLTGSAADVERLTPGLTSQYWQEDSGTVLLWGGDLGAQPDSAWLNALRNLRRRPLDGVIWVTSALAQRTAESTQTSLSADMMDSAAKAFAVRFDLLGWRLPLYVWSLHPAEGDNKDRITQPVGCLLPAACKPDELYTQLTALVPTLIAQGTQQISASTRNQFLLQLAEQLAQAPAVITEPVAALLNPYRPAPLAGIMFSPTSVNAQRTVKHHWAKDNRWDILLGSLPALPAGLKAKKLGFAWGKTFSTIAAGIMVLWGAGMIMSFLVNRQTINTSEAQVKQAADVQQTLPLRLKAQHELQNTLDQLEYRQQHTPWYSRFGLNQNSPLLAALWPHYAASAVPMLRDAAARHLEDRLNSFAGLPPADPRRDALVKSAYDQLKLYLMLSRPEKMDAKWFSKTLLSDWPQRKNVPDGIWQGEGPALLDFYARSLSRHSDWQLTPDENLVGQTRTLLVRLMGARNSESTLYQKMLRQVAHQYADMTLTDMAGDTDAERIFTTDAVVPGMFTRKAWEESVKPAIEKVVNGRREEMDWVLSDSKTAVLEQGSPEALQARLKERYFADFSSSWLEFLNSLHWQQAQTLSDAIDQLTLMADVRQSPLVALMNTLSIQGKTGQSGEALSDSLVKSAKNLLNRDEQPAIDQQAGARSPGPAGCHFQPDTRVNGQ